METHVKQVCNKYYGELLGNDVLLFKTLLHYCYLRGRLINTLICFFCYLSAFST